MSDEGLRYFRLEDLLSNPHLLDPPPVVVPRLAWEGRLTALGSEPKLGKSTLLGQATAAFVCGAPFLDEPLRPGRALWLALDEPLGDAVRRLVNFGATEGVILMNERPGLSELERVIREEAISLLVVDTVTEFVAGLVDDHNQAAQWQPVYAALRGMLQQTACAGLLSDHTGKANPHSLVGSLQKAAGVDVVLTMTAAPDSPSVRHIRARGRIACSDFSTAFDGERNTLATGELSLETRVYHAVTATPGLSQKRVRDQVGGKAKAVDAALSALLRRELIEDRGNGSGHVYHPKAAKQAGQGRDEGGTTPLNDRLSGAGQGGPRSGQGSGQGALSHTLKSVGGTTLATEEELEREAIAGEGA